jgi:hypothetical protein
MTQPTGGLGLHAGSACRLSANAAAMNSAFASSEKPIAPPFRLDAAYELAFLATAWCKVSRNSSSGMR